MINRVILVGRLTRDPELRYTPSGVAVANFTLAVNRTFTNQQGEKEADFINIVVWRKQAENCANYLRKGRLAGVEGRIQTRHYDNNEGKRVYVTEVIADNVQFLESAGSNRDDQGGGQYNPDQSYGNQGQQGGQSYQGQQDPFASEGRPIDISDDDLPF